MQQTLKSRGERLPRLALAVFLCGAAALQAACGGGSSDDSASAPSDEGQAALVVACGGSVDVFIAFLKGLGSNESAEPLDLTGITPPTDDAAEALPLI